MRIPLTALVVALVAGCDPFHVEFEPVEPAQLYRAQTLTPAPATPRALTVLDWNIKFGGGRVDFFFDCYGKTVMIDAAAVRQNLAGLAAKINEIDPDVVFLQEVDVDSRRTDFVDQAQWLLDHTRLNYGAYASQWRADYVPSDGLGAVDSGNLVLARWPLSHAERIALPLRDDQSGLTRYFYLRRNLLKARIEIPGRDNLWVINLHADAYGEGGTKRVHIDRLLAEMNALDDAGATVIGGGDLNTLPPGTAKLDDFPDSVCKDEEFVADDYRSEVGWTDGLYARYQAAIPTAEYAADNARYFSHTVDGRAFWNRTLDYLFTNAAFRAGSGRVHQDERDGLPTMPLSDHAPLSAILELP